MVKRGNVMVVVIPYPNGYTFDSFAEIGRDQAYVLRNDIIDYVKRVCTGPWNSDELDMLTTGVRVRLGSERDLFLLQLKYGDI